VIDATLAPLVCACASLRRAARAVTQAYEAELRPTGLRPTQLTLLYTLKRQGELTQTALDELLAIDSTTLSRTLRPLAARGWIRARAGEDRRERYWSLTSSGERELGKVLPYWHRAQKRLRGRLGADRFEQLLTELLVVARAARDSDAPPPPRP